MRTFGRQVGWLVVLLGCSGTSPAPSTTAAAGAASNAPWAGWARSSGEPRANPCPASEERWGLSVDTDGAVRPLEASERPAPRWDELPGDVPVGELGSIPRPGARRRVLTTERGWLVAADAGELGGGLFALARDEDPRRLDADLPEPIRWIERLDFGIVGVAGLCHGEGCARTTRLYRIQWSSPAWKVTALASLQGCAFSFEGGEGASEALLVSCNALHRVTRAGVLRAAGWQASLLPLGGPQTAARDVSGTSYVSFGRLIGRFPRDGEADFFVRCPQK